MNYTEMKSLKFGSHVYYSVAEKAIYLGRNKFGDCEFAIPNGRKYCCHYAALKKGWPPEKIYKKEHRKLLNFVRKYNKETELRKQVAEKENK